MQVAGNFITAEQRAAHSAQVMAARWKAKCLYWQGVAGTARAGDRSLDAGRVADEILARIERDGAVHRDALIETIARYAYPLPAPGQRADHTLGCAEI